MGHARRPLPRRRVSAAGITPGLASVLQVITVIGSPLALGTALLFYFGWVRSDVQARALGYDVSVLSPSSQDFVLRSINVLFIPLVLLLLLGLGVVLLHLRVVRRIEQARAPAMIGRAARGLELSWIVMLALGVLALVPTGRSGLFLFPFALTLGVLGTVYGIALRRRLARDPSRPATWTRALVTALIALLLFWDTEHVARLMGEAFAEYLESDPGQLASVTIYSPRRLHITLPGVVETRFTEPDATHSFRYEGLRLLQRSGGRYFLLHDGWSHENGRLLVISDESLLRVEFSQRRPP